MKKKYKITLAISAVFMILIIFINIPENRKEIKSENFIFRFSSDIDSSGIIELSKKLEVNHPKISKNLNTELPGVVEVNIYSQRWRYIKATGNWSASGSIEGISKLHFIENTWLESEISKIAVHEFVHAVVLKLLINLESEPIDSELFDQKISTFPVWLWEAISVYEAQQFYDPKTLEYLNNGKYPQISELNTRSKGQKIYTCGYTIIEYILKTYGRAKLIELIESYGDLKSVLNVTDAEFSHSWHKFVNEEYLN